MANSTSFLERHVGAMTEIVLDSSSPAELWPEVLSRLERSVGFDSGFIASTSGSVVDAVGAVLDHSEASLRTHVGACLDQITAQEIGGYFDRARLSSEIWSTRRRCELSAGYEPLNPRRAKHMLVRVGFRKGVLVGFNLERGASSKPFGARELELLDALAPLVQIGDALWRSRHMQAAPRPWAAKWRLTQRETEVAELVIRGLQNREIAVALGLSRNTVRNVLARVFPKADASTRAELVFVAHELPSAGQRSAEMQGYFARVRRAASRVPSERDGAHSRRAQAEFAFAAPGGSPSGYIRT